jgi:hypothetical protein
MINTLAHLRSSIENALKMIDDSLLLPTETQGYSNSLPSRIIQLNLSQASSLLDKCDEVNQQYCETKPVIRVIHHFACSGGTLVSKCLASMPNVFLLSEVHPHSNLQKSKDKPQYSPSDLAKLAMYAGVPEQKKLAEKIFVDSVKATFHHVQELGGTLVLRDHTHSDFCVGDIINNNTVVELLSEHFEINSLVTLRNPIDSYLSLVANGWLHFNPATFDEYCSRVLVFLKSFRKEQIIFYEDFVQKPKQIVEQMCLILSLSFDENFEAVYDTVSVTGDSGRKGDEIKSRPRRECSDEYLSEISKSQNFKILVKEFNFK